MTHTPLPPFAATSGPHSAPMLLIGEAWGEAEEQTRKPFVGYSGKELWLMLGEANPSLAPSSHALATSLHRYGNAWVKQREEWLAEAGICYTNVLALRPPGNKLKFLCVPKAELPDKGKDYPMPALDKGKYLLPEYLPELDRLTEEILTISPNLIVALGATATWALLRTAGISNLRGTITSTADGRKVLATFHPQFVNYNWAARPIVIADLMKAFHEAQFPEIRRPHRQVLTSPTLSEVRQWAWDCLAHPPPFLACDIETKSGQITEIGFARRRDEALVIPFATRGFASFWSPSEELEIWDIVTTLLESPIPKVGQNFLYDLQYILRMGIRPQALEQDTMLFHHSLFPEMRKGLGFLGSIYTQEPAWKLMRREKADTVKRDE